MDSEPETIGKRLRRLRIERGLSQRALASRGVSYAYISRIEAGARTPSVKALRVLAQRLGVSVEYLETGNDLGALEDRELRLREAELALRLGEETAAAEAELTKLVAEAEATNDRAVALGARGALALVAQQRGDQSAAIALLEAAFADTEVSPIDAWSLYATLARAYAAAGRATDAVTLLETALTELDRTAPHDDVAHVRAATLLSAALSDAGRLPEAREIIASALRRATGVADHLTRVRLYWSYARIALNEQKPRVALEHLRRAVALLETAEDTRELGRAHLFWAEILTFDGRAREADAHLSLAEELIGSRSDAEDRMLLRTQQARAAAETGQSERALRLAEEALRLNGGSDVTARATALWAAGRAHLDLGQQEAALNALREAMTTLADQHQWYEAATVARVLGQALRAAGQESQALDVLEEAVTYSGRGEGSVRRRSALRA